MLFSPIRIFLPRFSGDATPSGVLVPDNIYWRWTLARPFPSVGTSAPRGRMHLQRRWPPPTQMYGAAALLESTPVTHSYSCTVSCLHGLAIWWVTQREGRNITISLRLRVIVTDGQRESTPANVRPLATNESGEGNGQRVPWQSKNTFYFISQLRRLRERLLSTVKLRSLVSC